jgi:hypothetical protein
MFRLQRSVSLVESCTRNVRERYHKARLPWKRRFVRTGVCRKKL